MIHFCCGADYAFQRLCSFAVSKQWYLKKRKRKKERMKQPVPMCFCLHICIFLISLFYILTSTGHTLFWHCKLLTNSLLRHWEDLAYYIFCFIYFIYRVARRHNRRRIANAKLNKNKKKFPTKQYKIMTTIIITLSLSYFRILLFLFTKI